ncbi:hypothetical protein N8I77_005149 [Diaporthe amygdali]|uniref:Uncharacterized protein n=1 Tax=Phomopsis amygdali TaxID=1214568 RepID=A0AAD9SNJ0_PHOAM|nr:hypothetical protein N8I77_005149 [Diaporthe amygdali]
MIVNNSWPEYLGIRLVILLMRDLGLLCLGYFFIVFALGGVIAIAHPVSIAIEALGAIEILFYVSFFLPYRFFLQSHRPYKPTPLTRQERTKLFYKGVSLIPDAEQFIRKWTNNAHLEDIRIDNVKDWLLWALFETENIRDIGHDTHDELDEYIEHIRQQLGLDLKPEMLPISTRVTSQVLPPTSELCQSIATITAQIRKKDPGAWNDFVLVTSSYGTMLVKGLVEHPDFGPRISGNVLCDPVALLLHLPDVAFNFTRRTPGRSRRGRPGRANEWEITWASATEAGTAYSLARRFCWRECALWREDIMPSMRDAENGQYGRGHQNEQSLSCKGMRTTVIQGGEDCIAAAKNVAAYVYSGRVTYDYFDTQAWNQYQWNGTEEIELVFLDGKDHGQGMMVPRPSKKIRQVIEGYCRRALQAPVRPTTFTSIYDEDPQGKF